MSRSVWADITKYHGLDGLNNTHVFVTVLEADRFKVAAKSPVGEGPLRSV